MHHQTGWVESRSGRRQRPPPAPPRAKLGQIVWQPSPFVRDSKRWEERKGTALRPPGFIGKSIKIPVDSVMPLNRPFWVANASQLIPVSYTHLRAHETGRN